MMPQTKAVLYHLSKVVRAAVFIILCKPADCQPALDLMLAMVRCWTLCAEGASANLVDASSRIIPQLRRRLLLKTSRHPRDNCFGLHSQNVAGFLKNLEHFASWFYHFRQGQGTIDLVLLQETRVTTGESATMKTLYNSSWGFVHKIGRSLWNEPEQSCGGAAILLNPCSSITGMVTKSEEHWMPH